MNWIRTPDGEVRPSRWFSFYAYGWWKQRPGGDGTIYDWRSGHWPGLSLDGWHQNSPAYYGTTLQNVLLTPSNYARVEDRGGPDTEATGNEIGVVVAWEHNYHLNDATRLTDWDTAQRVDAHLVVRLRTEREADISLGLLLFAVLRVMRHERTDRSLLQENGEHNPGG